MFRNWAQRDGRPRSSRGARRCPELGWLLRVGTAGEAARFGKAAKRGRDLEGGRIPGFLFLLTGAGMGEHALLSV